MKQLLKLILLVVLLNPTIISAQEMPRASINSEYLILLPSDTILREYYFVDISHLDFEDEQEAVYLLTSYVTANLISNEVFYSEGYMVIKLHLKHIPESDRTITKMQNYLNCLTKPH